LLVAHHRQTFLACELLPGWLQFANYFASNENHLLPPAACCACRRMEDFNRERQLYSLSISPQVVPMMYFCEVRWRYCWQYGQHTLAGCVVPPIPLNIV
jgi:hypothetical protein